MTKPDKSTESDAKRMRWLLSGNGYFLEEQMLYGGYGGPCSDAEQDRARAEIDAAMEGDQQERNKMGKDTGKPPIGEAYDTGDEIVILGTPPEFPDSVPEDDPRRHNCDAMGCGCGHVLYRFRKPNKELCGSRLNA